MSRPFVVEFTEEELAMIYSAIEYMRDGFEHDMVPKDDDEQADLDKLPVLSERIKNVLDDAQQGKEAA